MLHQDPLRKLVYVVGGFSDANTPLDTVACLDPTTGAWSTLPDKLSQARGYLSVQHCLG